MKKNLINIITVISGIIIVIIVAIVMINLIFTAMSCHKVSNAVRTKVEIVFINNNELEPTKYEVREIHTTYFPQTELYLSWVTVASMENSSNSEKKLVVRNFTVYSIIKNRKVLMTLDPLELKESLNIY